MDTIDKWSKEFDDRFVAKLDSGEIWTLPESPKYVRQFISSLLLQQEQKFVEEKRGMIEVVLEEMRVWMVEFAGRPVDSRQDPFSEVADLRRRIRAKFLP